MICGKESEGTEQKGGVSFAFQTPECGYAFLAAPGMLVEDLAAIMVFFQVFNMCLAQNAGPVMDRQLDGCYRALSASARKYLVREKRSGIVVPRVAGG